ncbi:MAG: hypothetical protein PHT75_01300 [Bacilli bacterium]|nr:hypothetical protein [Bacilli bacterium]MDD3304752.1 hypothetical protein [Bacilli bacterium]MDD4053721.1 hypothetical protein [Bacilli bacterium]MDD4411592.1 hypothetical protein [Bacilli bacterium]
MKKKVKVLLVIIAILIIVVWLCIFVVDCVRVKNHQKPMLIFNTNHFDYNDGYVVEYDCLGYKYFEYRREAIEEEDLAPFWASYKE